MKLFSSLFVAALVGAFSLIGTNTATAGAFDGTFEGTSKIKIDGKLTTVDVLLTVANGSAQMVLTTGTTELALNVTAFVDNRGVFFGVLSDDAGVLVAGFGGRINGKSKRSHIVGKFLQEDYKRPFHLKRVVVE